jgi:CheY-like chemotaxis protein
MTQIGPHESQNGTAHAFSPPQGVGTPLALVGSMTQKGASGIEGNGAPVIAPQAVAARENLRAVILLVEDDPIIGQFITLVLKKVGYTTLHAPDAREALRISTEHPGPIDLLVADIVLPESNGFLLSQQLQAIHPKMRVLYTSGYADEFVQTLATTDNFQLLEKPFVTQSLLQKVRRTLEDTPRIERTA